MQLKSWTIEVNERNHIVEVEWWPPFCRGDVYADGELVYSWSPGVRGMPTRNDFEAFGKPFLLLKKGFVFTRPELYFDGDLVT